MLTLHKIVGSRIGAYAEYLTKRIVRVWATRDRVAAHDLMFSAPSSVSAVWALASNDLRSAVQRA